MRPEHVKRFQREGLKALNAKKEVIAGIEEVAKHFKKDQLKVVEPNVSRFKQEIFMYVWNPTKGEPVKEWDDCLDALRYAIYSEKAGNKLRTRNKSLFGL